MNGGASSCEVRWCANGVPTQEGFDDEHRGATLTAHEARWRDAGIGVVSVQARCSCVHEQRACERQVVGARAVSQQPVVANAMEASGQHVQQEAAYELLGLKRHGLVARSSLGPVVLP